MREPSQLTRWGFGGSRQAVTFLRRLPRNRAIARTHCAVAKVASEGWI